METEIIGFYDKEDYGLEENLIQNRTKEMDEILVKGKAFLQDYNNRIVKGNLEAE